MNCKLSETCNSIKIQECMHASAIQLQHRSPASSGMELQQLTPKRAMWEASLSSSSGDHRPFLTFFSSEQQGCTLPISIDSIPSKQSKL